jgi:DNA-binding MarR family transcriptional regulator
VEEGLLGSGFSLPEARLLQEIATADGATPGALAESLALDPGYLSRLVAALEQRGLLRRAPAPDDRRRHLLMLTPDGAAAHAALATRSDHAIAEFVAPLAADERRRLLAAFDSIERLLGDGAQRAPFLLRPNRPGDLGWITERHAALYQEELGWDAGFEAFVTDIAAAFLKSFDARRDCCWIAERGAARLGAVCLVHVSDDIAKLRLLLVEPAARGLGIGTALVEECLAFARRVGYAKVTLWTNDVLDAARRLFERAGFSRTGREAYRRFGKDLVGETWERVL